MVRLRKAVDAVNYFMEECEWNDDDSETEACNLVTELRESTQEYLDRAEQAELQLREMQYSYHDLHITTPEIERTSIFNLPYRISVQCSRVTGWQVWALSEQEITEELLGGEYDYNPESGEGKWLVLDVEGTIICSSRPQEEAL